MTFYRVILFAFFFIVADNVLAQGGDEIKATVNKNRILIGEPLELTIQTILHPTSNLRPVQIDSIPHFEILGTPVLDSHFYNDGPIFKAVYKITSFDSGHWVIPSFVLAPGIKTDTIPIDVVFSEFDPDQDYHDIKDVIEVKPAKHKKWWWYAIGGGLILLLVLLYFLRKKKPVPVIPQVAAGINAYEEAMKELEQLRQSKPALKEFHSKLTGIFRLYVYRKKGILSLQKTTDDLVLQLKVLQLEKEQFDKLSQALRLSDFVKFAKYNSTGEDDSSCFNTISETINQIELSGS